MNRPDDPEPDFHLIGVEGAPNRAFAFRHREVRIGRDRDAMVEGAGASVGVLEVPEESDVTSRYHARIVYQQAHFFVEDQGSNGTFINGERVPPRMRRELQSGDLIQLGPNGPVYKFVPGRPEGEVPAGYVRCGQCGEPIARWEFDTHRCQAKQGDAGAGGAIRRFGTATQEFIFGLIDQTVKGRTRRIWVAGGVLMLGIASYLAYDRWRAKEQLFASQRQVAQVEDVLKDMKAAAVVTDKAYARLQQEVAEIRERPAPEPLTQVNRYSSSIFMLTLGGEGQATAFAVTKSHLATNAHVARYFVEENGVAVAVMNDNPAARCAFDAHNIVVHPSYQPGDFGYDVALIATECDGLTPVPVASDDVLQMLERGMTIAVFGFPGIQLKDPENPHATLLTGSIAAIHAPGRLFIHSAMASPGTSGSPVFNANAELVGINAGGDVVLFDSPCEGTPRCLTPCNQDSRCVKRMPAGSGVNFAPNAAVMVQFMRSLGVQ